MEPEERSKGLAEYIERRRGDVFEVMAYSGTMIVQEDWIERIRRPYPNLPRYQRVLAIPLPPDFDWTKLNRKKDRLPDSILIVEDRIRYRSKGKKKTRPLTVFLDKPGRTEIRLINWTGKFGRRSKVWISEEMFKRITMRNLYVDCYYANQIFNRGKSSSGV